MSTESTDVLETSRAAERSLRAELETVKQHFGQLHVECAALRAELAAARADSEALAKEFENCLADDWDLDDHEVLIAYQIMAIEEALKLPVRPWGCLVNAGIATIGDLTRLNESQLLAIRGFGPVCLRQTKRALAKVGLRLNNKRP